MRVRRPETGRRRILDEEETYPGADRAQVARGGRRAGRGSLNPRASQEARHQQGELPPLAQPVRRDEGRRDEAPEGAGAGEQPPQEEDRRGSSGGHKHPKGGKSGKLLSPARRRAAVEHARRELGVFSERRACKAMGQARSTQRYVGEKVHQDRALAKRMLVLSRENPRYGYRRVWALLTAVLMSIDPVVRSHSAKTIPPRRLPK